MQINWLDILYIHARSLPNMPALHHPEDSVVRSSFIHVPFASRHGIYARLSAIS